MVRFFEMRAIARQRKLENENMFYDVEQENIMDMAAFIDQAKAKARKKKSDGVGAEVDEESKDGSVYLDELDMTSPNVIKAKPSPRSDTKGAPEFGSPSGYDADGMEGASPDPLARKLEGIAEETKDLDELDPDYEKGRMQEAKPMWGSPTIHNTDGMGEDFIGSISYETNRPMEPIKGPPIAASNFRIYGPATTGAKASIEQDYDG